MHVDDEQGRARAEASPPAETGRPIGALLFF
jgi:hypothetical protein